MVMATSQCQRTQQIVRLSNPLEIGKVIIIPQLLQLILIVIQDELEAEELWCHLHLDHSLLQDMPHPPLETMTMQILTILI